MCLNLKVSTLAFKIAVGSGISIGEEFAFKNQLPQVPKIAGGYFQKVWLTELLSLTKVTSEKIVQTLL